jgi:hypothetical protein
LRSRLRSGFRGGWTVTFQSDRESGSNQDPGSGSGSDPEAGSYPEMEIDETMRMTAIQRWDEVDRMKMRWTRSKIEKTRVQNKIDKDIG